MKFEKLKYVLKSNGKVLKDMNGRTKTPEQFMMICFKAGVSINTGDTTDYDLCVRELKDNKEEETTEQSVVESLDMEALFKDFVLIEDGKGHPIVKYTNPETNQGHMFGTVPDVDHKFIYKALISFGKETLANWKQTLAPYKSHLKLKVLTDEVVVEYVWVNLFSGLAHINRKYIDPNAMPVALQGKGKSADYIIPFTLKDTALRDLNPILGNFLERTKDHKYLCAIIASRLLGFRHAYIPYLVGAGGDGKSTFITFLDKLVNGYTANLDLGDSSYGLFGCVDKVFLFINDTSNKRVFYYETVKNISGNDYTRVNGKYQHAKDVKLPGLIIISSNQLPVLSKAEWLKRRARIFQVARMTDEQRENPLDVNTAADLMNSSGNEFLNYCLQCLSEVGNTTTGSVNIPPTHGYLMDSSETPEEDEYEDFLVDLGFSLNAEVRVTEYAFRKKIRTKLQDQRKSEYFMENFLAYLREKKGVTKHSGHYHGIGPKVAETTGTKFVGKTA